MKFLLVPILCVLGLPIAVGMAYSAPLNLVLDGFKVSNDSLWHFQTAAFRGGIFSPGKQTEIPGRDAESGQLKVDITKDQLFFLPRKLSEEYRSCFLAYRDDFWIDGAFASQVRIELSPKIINPSSGDSTGGLYALLRYLGPDGKPQFMRSSRQLVGGSSFELNTMKWFPIEVGNWLITEPMETYMQTRALTRVTGIGMLYISGTNLLARTAALRLDGFKATGEMSWPHLSGHPEKAVIWAGDSVELRYQFPPGLKAQWRWSRNEVPVSNADSAAYRFVTTLEDVRTHLFRAEAKLDNGDVLATETLRIQVKGKMKPVIRRQINDTIAPIGGEVTFAILAEGIPPLTYQWFHNGEPIQGAQSASYVFVPSHLKQGGKYLCEVTDRWGAKARSHVAKLLVKPLVESQVDWQQNLSYSVKAGVNATDFYQADPNGYPDTHFGWNYMQAGIQVLWDLSPRLALQGDLLYSRKGVRWNFEDHFDELKLDYAECPLFLRVRLLKVTSPLQAYFLIGGYAAVLLDAQHQEDWGDWQGDISASEFSRFDFGPSLGMVWRIGGMFLEWRTSVGAANLNSYAPEFPVRMWTASVMLGFTLIAPQEMAQ